MTLHADALRVLRTWTAPSPAQDRLRDRYVAYLEQHPDALTRACRPHHLTASMLVLDESRGRVLLTLHAKSGRWFQLGGHAEPGDTTLAGAALREALEESGLAGSDLRATPTPVLLDEHPVPFCGPGEDVHHLDVVFAGVARDGAAHRVSEESLDVAWWPVDDLPNLELSAFVEAARSTGQSTAQSTSEPGGGSSRAAADQPSR